VFCITTDVCVSSAG